MICFSFLFLLGEKLGGFFPQLRRKQHWGGFLGCTMNIRGGLPAPKGHFRTWYEAEGVGDSVPGVRSAHSGTLRGAGPCEDTGSAHSGKWGEAGPCEDTGCPSPNRAVPNRRMPNRRTVGGGGGGGGGGCGGGGGGGGEVRESFPPSESSRHCLQARKKTFFDPCP